MHTYWLDIKNSGQNKKFRIKNEQITKISSSILPFGKKEL